MYVEVICKEDFFIKSLMGEKEFKKGHKYQYKIDKIELVCDEQDFHMIDNFQITNETFRENFISLIEWRELQLKKII